MHTFQAPIDIIGVNPFVFVPVDVLQQLFDQSGKTSGAIPICGTVNGAPYRQTLVRYSGEWRLYINTSMLKNSPKRIGEQITITVAIDDAPRGVAPPPAFVQALNDCKEAKEVFDGLPASRRLEIVRYLAHLKTEEARARNIPKAINFLLGKGRFVGRDTP